MKKEQTTWWHFVAMILICVLISVAASLRAQNYNQKDISQSDFLIYLDTMPSHIPIGSQIPDSTIFYRMGDWIELPYKLNLYPVYELDEITTSGPSIKYIDTGIKSVESHLGTPWISEYDKSSIIAYLVNLIADLMEPGETITIKKVKE